MTFFRRRFFFRAAIVAMAVAGASQVNAVEHVSFKTRDGVTLKGVFLPPQANKPVVVMLHGLASIKEEWAPLEAKLAQSGWGYLAYDARGHGESSTSHDEKGDSDGYKYFGPPGAGSQWEKMIDDLGAAVHYLETDRGVDHKLINLAGASIGANVCLNFIELTRSIHPAILLSPGLNYQEIRTDTLAPTIKTTPVLLVASEADRYAFLSCKKLKSLMLTATLWTDVKEGHGVQMFDATLLSRIMEWLEQKK